jgi:hypothetical protein
MEEAEQKRKFEHEILRDMLPRIDRRLAEIEALISHTKTGDYYRQELESERRELTIRRRGVEEKLNPPKAPPPTQSQIEARERQEKQMKGRISVLREDAERFASHLEKQGDYRQARLQRLAAIFDTPFDVLREFGERQ